MSQLRLPVLMNVDHRIGSWEQTPAPSCRDRGWMRGWVGALCLSWWPHAALGCRHADGAHPGEDRHKAPASTQPRPPVPTERWAASVPMEPLLDSVGNIH